MLLLGPHVGVMGLIYQHTVYRFNVKLASSVHWITHLGCTKFPSCPGKPPPPIVIVEFALLLAGKIEPEMLYILAKSTQIEIERSLRFPMLISCRRSQLSFKFGGEHASGSDPTVVLIRVKIVDKAQTSASSHHSKIKREISLSPSVFH